MIDADGNVSRQVSQEPHPARRARLLGEVLFQARAISAIRCSRRRTRDIGVYICYDRHFPEGARELGSERRGDRLQSVGDGRGPVRVSVEARAAGARGGERLFRRRDQSRRASSSRGTSASSTARATSAIRAARSSRKRSRDKDELVVAELDLDKIREVRNVWQFFRDRRPETYGGL